MTDHWSLPIDAASATPVYVQVAQQLQRRIENGDLRRGSALPAERDFAAQLGISRVTVRQALALLEKQGLLLRKHGSGTFVTPPVRRGEMPSRPLGLLSSFSEDVRSRGQRPGGRVLSFERGRPTAHEALSLALSPTESVYRVRRLRTANDEPLAIEESTLPAGLVGTLTAAHVTDTSLYLLLRTRNLEPSRGIRHLRAINADLTLAGQLGVPVGAALVSTERVSWTAEGVPVEYARAQYRGDRFDFVMELHGDSDS
ncbi:GntR family transcriptional regulator [Deinococcus sp. KSM4-11]|uniref:GntR family transcriptional regulator n=1 Tax=Deinococcus sp. KSM4-11 TaxID=2568654 RepID=UPI001F10CD1C|nr:GntR family transcriptional regulator [Deinococcus sp. KSM4-11]